MYWIIINFIEMSQDPYAQEGIQVILTSSGGSKIHSSPQLFK